MTPITPLYFTAVYTVDGPCASLQVQSNNSEDVSVEVLHTSAAGITWKCYTFRGNESSDTIRVSNGERLYIRASHPGKVIAHAHLKVDTSLPERLPALLNPRSMRSMILQQENAAAQSAPLSPPLASAGILEADALAQALARPVEIARSDEAIEQLPSVDLDDALVRLFESMGAKVVTVDLGEEVAQ